MPAELPLSIGAIAAELHQPIHRIEYLLRSRKIPCAARIGAYRVFDASTVDRLREEVNVDRRRKAVS